MDDEMAGHSPAHDEGRTPESEGGPPAELFRFAASMARKGRYQEALRALRQAVAAEECSDAEALDLQARIYAQQGMLLRAESCWAEALRKDPGNAAFVAALARLRRVQTHSPFNTIRLFFLGALLLLIGGLGLATKGYYHVIAQQARLSSQLTLIESVLKDTHVAPGPTQAERANVSHPPIALRGMTVRNREGNVMLSFDSGLFSRGTRLTPDAKHLLAELAQQLEPNAARISIRVTGFTDSTAMPAHGRYIDNSALGMARALRAVEHMRNTSRLPADIFVVEGRGETGAPYPNDSAENGLRNRTVVIRISDATVYHDTKVPKGE